MMKHLRDIIPVHEGKKLASAVAGAVSMVAGSTGYAHHQQPIRHDREVEAEIQRHTPSDFRYQADKMKSKFRDLDNGIAMMRKKVKANTGPGWGKGRMSKNVERVGD